MRKIRTETVLILVKNANMAERIVKKVQTDLGKLSVVIDDVNQAKMLLEKYLYKLVLIYREDPEYIGIDLELYQELCMCSDQDVPVIFVYEHMTEKHERRIRLAIDHSFIKLRWMLMSEKIVDRKNAFQSGPLWPPC